MVDTGVCPSVQSDIVSLMTLDIQHSPLRAESRSLAQVKGVQSASCRKFDTEMAKLSHSIEQEIAKLGMLDGGNVGQLKSYNTRTKGGLRWFLDALRYFARLFASANRNHDHC